MGKLLEPQRPAEPDDAGSDPSDAEPLVVHGTPEQRERNRAALEWLVRRETAAAALSPAERQALERDWETFKRRMNETHSGGRELYRD
jgi:hypothetical protein